MKKLIIHSQESLRFVTHSEISYCKSDNCYTTIFLIDGEELIMCKSLKKVIEELSPNQFLRVSQSFVINKNCVRLVDKKKRIIELKGGVRIPFTTTITELISLMASNVYPSREVGI